jgi:hypothetical protein
MSAGALLGGDAPWTAPDRARTALQEGAATR